MAPPRPPMPTVAKPRHGDHFDAWNSSSTGHQRAENRLGGSIGWRQSRSMKLTHQLTSGHTGGKRISDTVGAGSEEWDEKAKALIPKDVRARARFDIRDMIVSQTSDLSKKPPSSSMARTDRGVMQSSGSADKSLIKTGMFHGLVIYINGSTHPLISDHKLKHLLAEHGARVSIHLGRRQVTHVILGRPCDTKDVKGLAHDSKAGAGGGLAATKIEKEIRRVGGCGVKVLDSIKNGKRLPETQYSILKMAAKGQQSVYGMFKRTIEDPVPSKVTEDSRLSKP
ncbi:MAG: hypothetical protein M1818_004544 [Claussenomyces sp. TS43310]|nr:MAG: hypothetical protein M1818_004544 [Claussenomyces sp. TS43310]